VALPIGALVFLLFGPVGGSTMDDEEYRNVVISLIIHARALLDGHYPFWTSDLGLGMPHPLHPTFFFHPLMPLFGVISPGTAVRLFFIAHGVLGAAGCWALMRHMDARRWTAALATSTWVLATPALNYALTDLWLAHFFGWSLYPWLLLCTRRILDHRETSQPWRAALQLGLVAGLLGVNGHLGQVPVLILPMAVMCLAEPRATARRLVPLLLAAAIGAAIAAPVVVRLEHELFLFPDVLRDSVDMPMDARAAADLVLRPILDIGPDGGLRIAERGAMVPFFGGPMFLLAVAYVVSATRWLGLFREPEAGSRKPHIYRQGLVAAFVSATVLLFVPGIIDSDFSSGSFLFRDPMTLFGIVLGSLAFETLARRSKNVATGVGVAQVLILLVCAWPFAWAAWESSGAERGALARTPTTEALRVWVDRIPGRWYLAPQLDALVREGRLQEAGLWRDIWIYRGLPIVNGSFKGVSADVLYPSGSLPIGRIVGEPATAQSAATLAGLGIAAVLATAGEPVAPALEEVARFSAAGETVRLLRNPAAWPGAAFVMPATVAAPLPALADCRFAGLFCRDFSPVVAAGVDTKVSVARRHGTLDASFAPADQSRVLIVSEMYRPEWTARANGAALPVSAAWGGVIAVTVPAGAGKVELRYRPALVMALTATSGLLLAGAAVTLALRRSRASGLA
jgi:hypothetical protein